MVPRSGPRWNVGQAEKIANGSFVGGRIIYGVTPVPGFTITLGFFNSGRYLEMESSSRKKDEAQAIKGKSDGLGACGRKFLRTGNRGQQQNTGKTLTLLSMVRDHSLLNRSSSAPFGK
jgi:hypothetical protein